MGVHGDGFTDGDREAVLEALATEQRLKHEGKPYSEAVIMACEVCLRVYARKPHLYQVPHEPPVEHGRDAKSPKPDIFTQVNEVYEEREARPRPNYWWMKD